MEGDTQQWDYSVFWQEALNQVRAHISEQEYVMWFRNIQYYASRENEIILAVPSSFYRDQVKQRYLKITQDPLFDLSGMSIQVSFEIVKLQPPTDHSAGRQTSGQASQLVDKSNYSNSNAPNHTNLQVPGSTSSQASTEATFQTTVHSTNSLNQGTIGTSGDKTREGSHKNSENSNQNPEQESEQEASWERAPEASPFTADH